MNIYTYIIYILYTYIYCAHIKWIYKANTLIDIHIYRWHCFSNPTAWSNAESAADFRTFHLHLRRRSNPQSDSMTGWKPPRKLERICVPGCLIISSLSYIYIYTYHHISICLTVYIYLYTSKSIYPNHGGLYWDHISLSRSIYPTVSLLISNF